MSFEPINIKIKDPRQFSEIAYLVDSPLFFKEANKIREKYKITRPMGNENTQQWALTNIPKEKIPLLFNEIANLVTFFSYDSNYLAIFEKAVLGGVIEDADYKNTLLVNFSKLPSLLTNQRTQGFGILLTPQTDEKDVVATFKQYQKIQKELNSNKDTFVSTDKRIDKRMEIERDREWYWKQKNKQTYWQIARSDGVSRDQFEDFVKDRIVKAIKSYKQKLT